MTTQDSKIINGAAMTTNRSLKIEFKKNGDVDYVFSRSGTENKLSQYIIEYPTDQVTIHGGKDLENDNFRRTTNQSGFVVISWEKVKDTTERSIQYTKAGYLNIIQITPLLLHYRETINIKGKSSSKANEPFCVTLHGRAKSLSAVKRSSKAVFHSNSGGFIHTCAAFYRQSHKLGSWYDCSEHQVKIGDLINLRPTELDQAAFYCTGLIEVDWILEVIETRND